MSPAEISASSAALAAIGGFVAKALLDKFLFKQPERIEERLQTLETKRVADLETGMAKLRDQQHLAALETRELRTVLEANNRLLSRVDSALGSIADRLTRSETQVSMQEKRGDTQSARMNHHENDVRAHCKHPAAGGKHDCAA
jgi:hypothetical protein